MAYRPGGQLNDTSNSHGRSVGEAWVYLFDRNEKRFRIGKWDGVLTDEEIILQMEKWFPKREVNNMKRVQKARIRYADSTRIGLGGVPETWYQMRLIDGRICRVTSRGRLIQEGGEVSKEKRIKVKKAARAIEERGLSIPPDPRTAAGRAAAREARKGRGKRRAAVA